jgi:hypothetical protein
MNDTTRHRINQLLEFVVLGISNFFYHDFDYFCTLVFVKLDLSENLIFFLLCEFIVVYEHFHELLSSFSGLVI